MRPTLDEVARLAGVSTSTASRALSGNPHVLPETRDRVRNAAHALRYRPNRIASALRTRSSELLGLVVNSLYNATFTTLADVLQARATDHGYQVLVCTTAGDPDREANFLDAVLEQRFAGVVVAGTGQNVDRINGLVDAGTAVVVMNREVPGARAPSVMPDYRMAARSATQHLLALGHRRIGYVGGLEQFTSGREHYAGFINTMAEYGSAVEATLVRCGPFEADFGQRSIRELLTLSARPSALLITNHEATFGALPVLVEAGIRVPHELSVACTEDAPWFTWWQPPLTVIQTRPEHMAKLALDRLLGQLNGTQSVGRTLVEPLMTTRASTGPVQAR